MPMGMAPASYVLWTRHLRHNPRNPKWVNRDRFVLSAGHGCMLLYALLHLTGYDLSLDDLKRFRQWRSMSPAEREAMRTRYQEFRRLPPADQQRLREQRRWFQNLPPEKKHELREQWKRMSPAERQAFREQLQNARPGMRPPGHRPPLRPRYQR